MEEFKYEVYVKVNENNIVTEIASNIQDIDFTSGWIQIDEGQGDKYAHAQGNYFPKEKPLKDEQFRCNYKLVDNKPVELSEEEKVSLFPTEKPTLNLEDRIAMLENLQLQQEGVI